MSLLEADGHRSHTGQLPIGGHGISGWAVKSAAAIPTRWIPLEELRRRTWAGKYGHLLDDSQRQYSGSGLSYACLHPTPVIVLKNTAFPVAPPRIGGRGAAFQCYRCLAVQEGRSSQEEEASERC